MEVFALVGPSGTGKSFRAQKVAHDYNIDLIIDDGLLIKGSKILEGISAKKQSTRVGAIRTALFLNKNHAETAKKKIFDEKPNKILILGTSNEMVFKIAERLDLPAPKNIINIKDIATEDEIKKANYIRKKYNKHVIPVPTVEVKPKLSGILSIPMKTIFSDKKSKKTNSQLSIEQTIVQPTFSSYGRFLISNNVLKQITIFTIEQFPEIEKVIKTNFITESDGLVVKIEVAVFWGHNLKDLGKKIQEKVFKNIDSMTALNIERIDILFKKISIPS